MIFSQKEKVMDLTHTVTRENSCLRARQMPSIFQLPTSNLLTFLLKENNCYPICVSQNVCSDLFSANRIEPQHYSTHTKSLCCTEIEIFRFDERKIHRL